jgi:hypothetical protein
MRERLAGRSMPSAVWRSPSFVSKASVPFLMDTGQPPHAQTEAWPGWAFVRELISPDKVAVQSLVNSKEEAGTFFSSLSFFNLCQQAL